MNWVDTHAHLYSAEFGDDRTEMVMRSLDAGVMQMYLPNVDKQSIEGMLALEAQFPKNIFPMMGLHPCSVQPGDWKDQLKIVKEWLDKRQFCAVGEIGIDLYWDKSTLDIQIEAFRIQSSWAIEKNLPIVIHSRESIDILIGLVGEMKVPEYRGIFHCFSGTEEQANEIIELGFLLGIGGPLTYKKSTLPDAIRNIPLEYIVLETDAPYLPPTPHRGKRNESSYIPLIGSKLAEIKEMTEEEVAMITSRNARRLYGTE
jgi:TatD DNase family protein